MKKLFDVVIVRSETSEVVSVIGRKLDAEKAEKRIETGCSRIAVGEYFVGKVKPGSKVGDKYKGVNK